MSKKEKVAFISDSFMDKTGAKHSFVIAAVSIPIDELCVTVCPANPEESKFDSFVLTKAVSLGYSFCNANDEFNLDLGKTIAEGRAKKHLDRMLFVTDSGLINTSVVTAILKQEADFVKANPQLFIKGYKEEK